jgi:hypothetical protein
VTISLIPLAIAWLFATTLGAAVGAPPEGSPAIGYGFVIGAFGMWAIFALRMAAIDAFHRLPTLPDGVDARVGRAETVDCGACGAPTRFGQRDFASMCGYCGAENYRVALARRAHAGAAKANREAKVSVYAAMLEVRARFRGMLETMEIAALLAGFVVALAFIVRFLDQC